MRRLGTLGLVLLAVLLAGAAASASAWAVALPEFETETSGTGKSGASDYTLGANEVRCRSATEEARATSHQGGVFTTNVNECTVLGEECHSLGGVPGTISFTGEWRLVRLKTEDVATLLTAKAVHVQCKVLSLLILIEGSVLGLVTPILTKTKKFASKVLASGGKQEITEYETDTGGKQSVSLKGSVDNGTAEPMTVNTSESEGTTAAETQIIKTT